MSNTGNKKTFEEMYGIISDVINKRQGKWKLRAITWFDFEDVKQIVEMHIFTKWHLWDQSRAIEPWVNRIATNQIRNIIRNNYSSFARPCLSCPFNQDKHNANNNKEYSCGFTPSKKQCNECPLYSKWEKTKKNAYDLKITVSLENHKHYHANLPEPLEQDFQDAEKRMHVLMKNSLSDKHFVIYKMFFIDCLNDKEIAKILQFKTTEKNREAGYKQIKNLKTMLYQKAKELLKHNEVFYV